MIILQLRDRVCQAGLQYVQREMNIQTEMQTQTQLLPALHQAASSPPGMRTPMRSNHGIDIGNGNGHFGLFSHVGDNDDADEEGQQ
jgi:hypothetical protein